MKVGVIIFGDIRFCPYIRKYIETLETEKVDYDIILWNRVSGEDNSQFFNAKIHEYKGHLHSASRISKIMHFIAYRSFVKKIIKQEKYDRLIVMPTMTAVLLAGLLEKKYKNNYIFDYRDVTYEKYSFYKKNVKKLVRNSYFTAISSEGFKNVIGSEGDIFIAHNFNYSDIENGVKERDFAPKDKLNICFIGMIREYDMMQRLLEIFGGDSRFNLVIHGDGDLYETVKDMSSKYTNVVMTGKFTYKDKPVLLKDMDMLAYFYPATAVNMYAIANKFYDGMIYKIPTIANAATYSGKKVKDLNVGCNINWNDSNEKIKEEVFNYYNNIDSDEFNSCANNYIKTILEEDKKYIERIKEFVRGE